MLDAQKTPHSSPVEYVWENWPRYNGTALCITVSMVNSDWGRTRWNISSTACPRAFGITLAMPSPRPRMSMSEPKMTWNGKTSEMTRLSTGRVWSDKGRKIRHHDVIKWKHFPRYWPFVRGIHQPPVNSPLKGQWRWALMFSLFCVWINGWVNNREAGDLRRYCAHCDIIVIVEWKKKTL